MPEQKEDRPETIDFDVLPPQSSETDSKLARWIAMIMDDLIKVPGTNFKFGLDPLLGLLPGVGDSGTAFVSMSVLIQAASLGAPKIALARMALNIMINTVLGALPFLGDAFSVWFKSNKRNYKILRAYADGTRRSTKGDWAFLIFLVVVLSALVIAVVGLVIFTLSYQLNAIFSLFN